MAKRRARATDYEFSELPSLPEPWEWEKCRMDGNPTAVKTYDGVRVSVYPYSVGETDTVGVAVNRVCDTSQKWVRSSNVLRDKSLYGTPPWRIAEITADIRVFVLVMEANSWWHRNVMGVEPERKYWVDEYRES